MSANITRTTSCRGSPPYSATTAWRLSTTPKTRFAQVICFDADVPQLVQQAGDADADIIIVPPMGWRPEVVSRMLSFRAIENGTALVKRTDAGLSIAVDHNGQVLAKVNHYQTTPNVMISQVPMQGVGTVYAVVGNIFAWASIVGLGILVVVAFRSPKPQTG